MDNRRTFLQKMGACLAAVLWGTTTELKAEPKQYLHGPCDETLVFPRMMELIYWKLLWRDRPREAKFLHFNNIREIATRFASVREPYTEITHIRYYFKLPEGISVEEAEQHGFRRALGQPDGVMIVSAMMPPEGLQSVEDYRWRPACSKDIVEGRRIRLTEEFCRKTELKYLKTPDQREGEVVGVSRVLRYFVYQVQSPEVGYTKEYASFLKMPDTANMCEVEVKNSLLKYQPVKEPTPQQIKSAYAGIPYGRIRSES